LYYCTGRTEEGKFILKQREILQRPLTNLAKVMTRRIAEEITVKPKEEMEAGAESCDSLKGKSCNSERSQGRNLDMEMGLLK